MTTRPIILVIDDDVQIQRVARSILTARNYQVAQVLNGAEALQAIADISPALIILDLMLPGMDGLTICREARQWYPGPILVLSARGQEHDKIKALDLGADDYLTKPFAAGELLARLRALLRRVNPQEPVQSCLTAGEFVIDLPRRQVTRAGIPITLTPVEYDLLLFLVQNLHCVVPSARLLQHLWGQDDACDTQTLRSHISHLRRKIEPEPAAPQYLLTEPGVGFRFTVSEE